MALELFRCGYDKEARQLAEGALAMTVPIVKDGKPPPVAPALVALAVVLDKPFPKPRLTGEPGEERPNQEDLDNLLLGRADGLARRGRVGEARELLGKASMMAHLTGLVALADLAAQSPPIETADLTAALEWAEGSLKGQISPWLLFRLAQLAAHAGLADRAQALANQISDPGLKGQIQLTVFRSRLDGMKGKADEALAAGVAEQTGAASLAWQAWARHNARLDKRTARKVEDLDEANRPAALAGIALGLQDKRR